MTPTNYLHVGKEREKERESEREREIQRERKNTGRQKEKNRDGEKYTMERKCKNYGIEDKQNERENTIKTGKKQT